MPNWCSNYLTVSGPKDSLEKLRDELKTATGPLSFENHVPADSAENDSHYTAWGTKWDVSDSDVSLEDHSSKEDDAYLTYRFTTAWSPPCLWLGSVVELFPDLTFSMFYEEPGVDFYGEASGEDGLFSEESMTRDDYLNSQDDTYSELIKEVGTFTQEELIKYFSGVSDFSSCCCEEEEWNEALNDKYNWDEVDMYNYQPLAEHIIPRIEFNNLPLFMNVDWGCEDYNQMFKERISKGE